MEEQKIEVPLALQGLIALKWILILSGICFWYVLGSVSAGKSFGVPGLYSTAEAQPSDPLDYPTHKRR